MKHVILGGAGFLGANLSNRLLKNEEQVLVFDRATANYSRLYSIDSPKLKIVHGEFSETYPYEQLLEKGDVVYHLICTTNPSLSNHDMAKEIKENILPTLALLNACITKNIEKIVFLSSGGTVYGRTNLRPFCETDLTNPICSYGAQKLLIEKYLQIFHHVSGLDYRIIRLSNPYGPFQNPLGGLGAVTAFTYHALRGEPVTLYGDGSIIRDYIYVEDAIEGILRISKCRDSEKLFNLGSGYGVPLKEVLATIEKVLGKKIKIFSFPSRNVDVPYNVLDISRYRRVAENFCPVSLEEGIKKLVYYFVHYGEGR